MILLNELPLESTFKAARPLSELELAFCQTSQCHATIKPYLAGVTPTVVDWCVVEIHQTPDSFHEPFIFQNPAKVISWLGDSTKRFLKFSENRQSGFCDFSQKAEELRNFAYDDDHFEKLKSLALRSLLTLPLRCSETQWGWITFISSEPTTKITFEEKKYFVGLSHCIATALHSAARQSKTQMISAVSHELRNPLNVILGWSQLLKDLEPLTQSQTEAIEVILRNAQYQATLLDDLLDASRFQIGEVQLDLKNVRLASFLEKLLGDLIVLTQKKGIDLRYRFSAQMANILADANRLTQVISNLINNALKYTPRGGQIMVALDEDENNYFLSVQDTGHGINTDFLPHVFDLFCSRDSTHQGLGLGLFLVKKIVEAHHAEIKVQSEGEGLGACFTITFRKEELVESETVH